MHCRLLGLVAVAATLAMPAWAHHSHSAYEVVKWSTLEGVVREVHFILPHS